MSRVPFLLALLLVTSACLRTGPPDPPTPATPSLNLDEAKGMAEPRKEAAPLVAEADVQALLEGWLKAQNDGDFAAYSATYADKFFGIKRSGPRTYQYVRDGWLADRERMFRKPMVVEAADVAIGTAREAATVAFTQTWSSGTYKDVGPKQLVVVPTEGGLRIAREEMLRSTLVDAPPPAGGALSFAYVEEHQGTPYVRVADVAGAIAIEGGPSLVSTSPAVTRAPVHGGKVAEEEAAVVGRTVTLYDAGGEVCTATVGDLVALTRFWGHFGMVETWDGSAREWDPGRRQPTRQEIADEIANMHTPELWAELRPGEGQVCTGATWARDAALPAPKPWTHDATLAEAMRPTAEKAFRKLPGYAAQQEAFAAEGGTGTWHDGPVLLTAFTDRASGGTYVTAAATGGDGCGAFWGELWAVWEVTSGGRLTLRTDGREPGVYFVAQSAVDLDGDQVPELLGLEDAWVPGPALVGVGEDRTFGVVQNAGMPSFDCPC